MTGIFKVDGTKVTVAFSYTAKIELVQDVVNACAEHLWIDEENLFIDTSNQDKLDIVDKHIKSVLLNMADTFKVNKAQELVREEAVSHTLGE